MADKTRHEGFSLKIVEILTFFDMSFWISRIESQFQPDIEVTLILSSGGLLYFFMRTT